MMDQSIYILKTASSAPLPDSHPSNDPQFQGFGGETTSIQLRLRLRDFLKALNLEPVI
jgi:hypothetical protein